MIFLNNKSPKFQIHNIWNKCHNVQCNIVYIFFSCYKNYCYNWRKSLGKKKKNFPTLESRGCFPSVATLKLANGRSVAMSELQVGDQVQTGFSVKILFLFKTKKY